MAKKKPAAKKAAVSKRNLSDRGKRAAKPPVYGKDGLATAGGYMVSETGDILAKPKA